MMHYQQGNTGYQNRNPHDQRQGGERRASVPDKDFTWMTKPLKNLSDAEHWAKEKVFTTTRLRNIFGQLRQLEAKSFKSFDETQIKLIGARVKYLIDKDDSKDKKNLPVSNGLFTMFSSLNAETFKHMMHHMEAWVALSKQYDKN